MANKIPKKLMREFKQVVGITGAGSAYWQPELAQVIDLAAEWCIARKWYFSMVKLRHSKGWVVMVNTQQEEGYLPRAIMTAVVAASKGVKP